MSISVVQLIVILLMQINKDDPQIRSKRGKSQRRRERDKERKNEIKSVREIETEKKKYNMRRERYAMRGGKRYRQKERGREKEI